MDTRKRRILWTLVRVLLTAAFVVLLILWVDWGEVWAAASRLAWTDGIWVLLLVVPAVEVSLRWWLVLRAAGLRPPFLGVLRLTFVGLFFNNFLPGGAGGDLARVLIAAGDTEKKGAVVGTVIVDRVVGMVTLFATGLVAAAVQWGRPGMAPAVAILGAILGGGAIALAVYFNPWLRGTGLGRWLAARMPGRDRIREAEVPFRALASRPALLAACVGLSVLGQMTGIAIISGLAHAMDLSQLRWGHLIAVLPVVFTVNALPISIGGWGVGEAAYVQLLGPAGVGKGEAVALALLFRFATILTSLPGAVIFGIGRAKPGMRSS